MLPAKTPPNEVPRSPPSKGHGRGRPSSITSPRSPPNSHRVSASTDSAISVSPDSVITVSSDSVVDVSSTSPSGNGLRTAKATHRATNAVPHGANANPSTNRANSVAPPTDNAISLATGVPKSANTDYKSALTHGKATGDGIQLLADTQSVVLNRSSSKQLIYLKIKPSTFSADQFWFFQDFGPIQQQLLSQLAAIPLLSNSKAFAPDKLQFALSKHHLLNGKKTKGHYFTAGFTLSDDLPLNLPRLILEAQSSQAKGFFTFNLTATSQKGSNVIKAKVVFSENIELLFDLFQLEFQVKVPLVVSLSPQRDFATLIVEILFPTTTSKAAKLNQHRRLLEIERIESFCNPIKHTSSEHGVLINRLMTGKFPLNLEDTDGRDVAICQRLVFAAFYGLDLRPRHQERFIFMLPVLSDNAQLERTPAVFRSMVASHKAAFIASGIAPTKSLSKKSGDTPSSSDSETEELFLARVEARTVALEALPVISLGETSDSLEFPRLDSRGIIPLKFATVETALCSHFLSGGCSKGQECELIHQIAPTKQSILFARSPHAKPSRPVALYSASASLERQTADNVAISSLLHDMITEIEVKQQLSKQTAASASLERLPLSMTEMFLPSSMMGSRKLE